MKKFIKITFRIFLLLGVVALAFFAHHQAANTLCKEMSIEIDYQGNDPMFDKNQIQEMIDHHFTSLINVKMGVLPVEELEDFVNAIPEVKRAEVYTTIFGKLGIKILQRYPVANLFTEGGNSYYMDKEGVVYKAKFPGHPRVMIVNGSIPRSIQDTSIYSRELRSKIALITNKIDENDFLRKLTEEIYVHTKSDFEIIPKIGQQIIKLGDVNEIDKKLEKLQLFYSQGITAADGWKRYKTIDLKFDGQVVCSK